MLQETRNNKQIRALSLMLSFSVMLLGLPLNLARAYPAALDNSAYGSASAGAVVSTHDNKLLMGDTSVGSASSENELSDSFHQFINSKALPESVVIGELKPNASALEMMLLRNKIANTIRSMQEMDNKQRGQSMSQYNSQLLNQQAECFIELTRVEKIPGKCHRASGGIPICQSENYMTISNECN